VIETKQFLTQTDNNEVPCKQLRLELSEKIHEENESKNRQELQHESDFNNNCSFKLERPSELLLIKAEEPKLAQSDEMREEQHMKQYWKNSSQIPNTDLSDVDELSHHNRYLKTPIPSGKHKSDRSSESDENYQNESEDEDDEFNDTESEKHSSKAQKKSKIKVKFRSEANGEEDVFDFEKNKLQSPMKSSPGHQFIKRLSLTFSKPPRLNRKGSSILDEIIRSKRTPIGTPTTPTKTFISQSMELTNEVAELNYYLEKENGYGDGLDDSYFIEETKTSVNENQQSHYKSDPDDDDDFDDDLSTTTNSNTATSSSKKTSMQSEKMIEMKKPKAQQASINKKFKKLFSVKRQSQILS
jgi:hypothetical protein